jgi:hypothetical protein
MAINKEMFEVLIFLGLDVGLMLMAIAKSMIARRK